MKGYSTLGSYTGHSLRERSYPSVGVLSAYSAAANDEAFKRINENELEDGKVRESLV